MMTARGNPVSTLWQQLAVAAAIASLFAAGQARANGTNPTVVAGQASFSTLGSSLSISNSPGTIINWQGFSIGAGETTRFIQQSAASSVLNRVIGPDPSSILGTLTSNGRIFLINPSGILVGQDAHIDVSGLVASTLNLNNQDFLEGRLNFSANSLAGKVENQGSITTPSGGSVYLVGSNVTNSGIINSPQGDVILVAGQSVKIFDSSTPGVRVEVTASDNSVVNLGGILAQSGEIGIYGAVLRNAGIIDADQVVRDINGKIVLRAKQDVTLDASSRLSANGEQGGEITVQSETGTTLVSGSIEAKGTGAGQTGGTVQVLGDKVGLFGADINVSGDGGGGTVLIGGDYQGTGAVQRASATYMSPDSTINADAVNNGNGGKVILWSDGFTSTHGTIYARGGAQSGDGGLIETSGHHILDATGVRGGAGAPHGTGGLWLFDPDSDILINAGATTTVVVAPNTPVAGTTTYSPSANTTNILNTDLNALLNAGTDVRVITTNAGGTQVGNITVAAAITNTSGGARTLTLNSGTGGGLAGVGGSVIIDATLSGLGGANTLAVNLENATAGGGVSFTANGNITTAGGNIQVLANTGGVTQDVASTLNSGAGTIAVTSPVGITIGGTLASSNGTGTAIVVNAGNGTAAGTATGGDIAITTGTISLTGGGGAVLYTGNLSSTGVLAAAGGSGSGRFRYNSSPTTQNYSLALNPAAVSAVFREAALLTVTANNASKAYGTDDPAQSYQSVTGYLNGDTAGLTGSYVRTAGELVGAKTITQGTVASNVGYSISFTGGKLLTITQAPLTGTIANQTKTYGTDDPALPAVTLAGVVNRTVSTWNGNVAVNDTGNVTTTLASLARTAGETVALAPYAINSGVLTVLAGSAAGNYSSTGALSVANSPTLAITQAPVTGTIANQTKTYGTDDPALPAVTLAGVVNRMVSTWNGNVAVNDTGNVTTTLTSLARTAGETVALAPYAINSGVLTALAGSAAGNYSSTGALSVANSPTLAITQAPATGTIANQTKTYGTNDPALPAVTLSGVVNRTVSTWNGNVAVNDTGLATTTLASLTRTAGEVISGSPYSITGGTLNALTGSAAGNYTASLSTAGNALTITQTSVTGMIANQTKVYGTDDPALPAVTLSGLVNRTVSTWNGSVSVNDTGLAATTLASLTRTAGEVVSGSPYSITGGMLNALTGSAAGNYTANLSTASNTLTITPAPLNVAANPQSKIFGTSDPALTFSVTGLANNPALGITDTADAVLSGELTRVAGESALGGPYAIIQGSLAANSNYTLGFTPNYLIIIGAAAEPVLGFNPEQVVFAGVINNEFYYRPGNFWHISLNPNNADPGFDVMRGTNDFNARLNRFDSDFGGDFFETWSFPQQFEKVDEK